MPTLTFSANGKYLFSGHIKEVRVWRVEDGKEMARLEAEYVSCLAVSKDGKWVAAAGGTVRDYVVVWDANTYKERCRWRTETVDGLDFSPDATRLVAASRDKTATIWDVATEQAVRRLWHKDWVYTAKYSPEGDRIATATSDQVQVWDSEDGRLLHEIQVSCGDQVGLVWIYNLLFVTSKDKVWKIKGTTVSKWSIPQSKGTSRIAVQSHGEFVVYTTTCTVRFWDVSTHAQLPPIQHSRDIKSVALSPDDQFIAIAGYDRKITIKRPSHISVSIAC